jgi:hypothetical protein
MIQTVAQFLDELLERQKLLLDEEAVKHGPSIGDMYESLMGIYFCPRIHGPFRLIAVSMISDADSFF